MAGALLALGIFDDGVLQGFAVVREEAWSRRAVTTDFYIAP